MCCQARLDVFFAVRSHRQSQPLARWIYDGCIGVGFAVAGDFLAYFATSDLQRTSPLSSVATAIVASLL